MARRYDGRTTTFSPEGRLYQIEYAMEAIGNSAPCLGMVVKDGIILASEKRIISSLLDDVGHPEKIFKVNDDIAIGVCGVTADSNVMIQKLRLSAQRHQLTYHEPIPIEQLVTQLCDVKQRYTQFGGMRPFGVSFLYAGWDKQYGLQLFASDPSGNYCGWKANCIGENNQTATSILTQDYKEDMSIDEGCVFTMKIFSKMLDAATLSGSKVDLMIISRIDGKTVQKLVPEHDINKYIKINETNEKTDRDSKK